MFCGILLHAERAGNLFDVTAFVMTHYEGSTLDVGELLQCGFEKINDLAALGESLRRGVWRSNAIQPMRSAIVFVCGSLSFIASLPHADQVERAICGDPIKPGSKSRTSVEAVELFVSAQEGLLH